MMTFNELDQVAYESVRFTILANVEENGKLKLEPYLDSKRIPTIGLGMNLRNNAIFDKITLDILGIEQEESSYKDLKNLINYPQTSKSSLQSALNEIMADRAADDNISAPNKRSTFAFANEAEIQTVFNAIVGTYENKVDSWLSGIPNSKERAALTSLAYNTVDGAKSLLGPKLKSAVENNNRPEAWYEIRYQSNGDVLAGIAKRRYYESEIFGLYDNAASVNEAEAKAVFKMHTTYEEDKITNYDKKYRNWKNKKGEVIDMLEEANTDYKTNIVQTLEESLLPARTILSTLYNSNSELFDEVLVDSEKNLLDKDVEATNSLMFGELGEDTYYFPSLSGQDVINDVNADGKIQIGKVKLTDPAHTKFDVNDDAPILSRWTLNEFELTKVDDAGGYNLEGNNLAISAAGDYRDFASRDKITINNYPFDSNIPAFGINLDMELSGHSSASQNYQVSDDNYIFLTNNPNPDTARDAPLFKTADDKNFFGLIYKWNRDDLAVRVFNEEGENLSTELIAQQFSKQENGGTTIRSIVPNSPNVSPDVARLSNGNVAYIYGMQDRVTKTWQGVVSWSNMAYLTIIDPNGKIISNEKVGEITSEQSNDRQGSILSPRFVGDNGMCFRTSRKAYCATLDEAELHIAINDDYYRLQSPPQDNTEITLSSGKKISSGIYWGYDHNDDWKLLFGIKTYAPIYTPIPDTEKIKNYDISSDYTTDPSLSQFIISLQKDNQVNLEISANANAVGIINGFSGTVSDARLILPYDLSESKVYQATSDEFSIDELLTGKFKPSVASRVLTAKEEQEALVNNDAPELVAEIWRRDLGENVVSNINNASNFTNSTNSTNTTNTTSPKNDDDDYYYYDDDYYNNTASNNTETAIDLDSPQPHTIIILPNNQTIILSGIEADKFLNESQSFITDHSPSSQPSNNPSADPSGQPSSIPTHIPSVGEVIMPTSNPTGIPSGTPSSDPSSSPTEKPSNQPIGEPTSDPSSNPSNNPSADPTKNPTSNPTGKPSNKPIGEPTSDPSSNPSGDPSSHPSNEPSNQPTGEPTSNPSSKPSHHPTAGILETGSPSSYPTNKPFENPSTIPSYRPSEIPSFEPSNKKIESSSPSSAEILTNSPSSKIDETFSPSLATSNYPTESTQPPSIAGRDSGSNNNQDQLITGAAVLGSVLGAIGLGFIAKKIKNSRSQQADRRKTVPVDSDNYNSVGNNQLDSGSEVNIEIEDGKINNKYQAQKLDGGNTSSNIR